MKQQVILINSLADFEREVPTPAVVRLNLVERRDQKLFGKGMAIPTLWVSLNLQGVNTAGEVVWLHDSYELDQTPGGDRFWTSRDESIYNQMRVMKEMVSAHLVGLGYEVRAGQYGLPRTIMPVKGVFECARWTKIDDELRIVAASGDS